MRVVVELVVMVVVIATAGFALDATPTPKITDAPIESRDFHTHYAVVPPISVTSSATFIDKCACYQDWCSCTFKMDKVGNASFPPDFHPSQRTSANADKWMRLHKIKRIPKGCQLDHSVPLMCGGYDVLDNLCLRCGKEKIEKEKIERDCVAVFKWLREHECPRSGRP